MAPELLTHGHASKASDVYAFGVLLWELATAGRAFAGTPRALLGHQIVQERRRPAWPMVLGTPFGSGADGALNTDSSSEARYRALVERCWAHEPADRWAMCVWGALCSGSLSSVALPISWRFLHGICHQTCVTSRSITHILLRWL